MTLHKKIPLLLLFLLLLGGCKQRYDSPYKSPATGYLVVEGYISGNSPTRYTLSRVIELPGDSSIPMETKAKLQVEGNDNTIFPLGEQGNGVYGVGGLALSPTVQYRLRIQTSNGESYLSDYVPFKPTPPIDSINWIQDADGVTIYANTHDPANSTRYYQWEFDETWAYDAAEFSYYKWLGYPTDSVRVRADSEFVFHCWQNKPSTPLLLGSSVKLAQDVIYRQPLQQIPTMSQQFSILYSTMVRQYALTQAGYDFLSLMKSNTESLGSIFDAQPSQLKGNIHCLTNPAEPVVGYVSAGTVQQQRIFISRFQVGDIGYQFACQQPDTPVARALAIQFFEYQDYVPLGLIIQNGQTVGWTANAKFCVDCTIQGGTTKKPSFWPN